ncbi:MULTISPECIES: HEPN domain-containing protein [Pseudomonas]|uniref:HEPN domain-containing protein n=1 Tax=Pseudomonas phytophila TaxID=2867264 RepID=A0ABY6FB54_9PSED|nr:MULTISPECIES: HEPN domain-containing protein [Pseudomonas]MCD5991600.1 HEPN domain-containing protein [Pseudomonas quasicaspiana]MDU8362427.1 HEPN domain-containing protein [Pseudomonas syringae group sp. J309-1]UXZ95126.1 HEPN domain-containing protein [Pseudomonas phytophila]
MTLENLLGTALESIHKDSANIDRLISAARRSLADAQLTQMSNEGRFDMAYKSIMQAANAALQANGFRTLTSKPGHHMTMIQTLPTTIGLDRPFMITLDGLRKLRNLSDYSGDPISEAMANEAVEYARRLFEEVEAWVAVHP